MLSESPAPATPREPLTARQAEVLNVVLDYYIFLHQPCPARYIAGRFNVHHEAVRGHFAALYRKGWLRGETSPATPRFIPARRPRPGSRPRE